MQWLGCLMLASFTLLALPAVQGVCPPRDRIMISGWFEFGRSCIGISHRIRMNFREATFFCQRYGGSLYALDSPSKNNIMLSYLTTVFGNGRRQKFWTGYYKAENALGWRWTTGSTSQYTDWEPGKPATSNEALGAVAWGGTHYWKHTWQDEPLSASFAFICQAPAMSASGQPYPPPTFPPIQPANPGPWPGPGPNTPVNPGPGAGPVNPNTPINPNVPMTPGAGPVNPGTGTPLNPAVPGTPNNPAVPGTPNNPGMPGGGAPNNPTIPRPGPGGPAVIRRGYPQRLQHLLAVP
ncbi:C-type lectin mannose-binding isoform-like [Diadema antillarum]|uniref:C-type lectin mannose-binding isoform-like n=1 Tax=Diadema antillarum TaxID=105358 RepID=UPI003A89EC48